MLMKELWWHPKWQSPEPHRSSRAQPEGFPLFSTEDLGAKAKNLFSSCLISGRLWREVSEFQDPGGTCQLLTITLLDLTKVWQH